MVKCERGTTPETWTHRRGWLMGRSEGGCCSALSLCQRGSMICEIRVRGEGGVVPGKG